jgi:O-acetyl-ADP-ribose deacetylase (regulator of RNase III)
VKASVQFVTGDITNQRTDAIVNAANTELILGTGVAGAIRRVGGEAIQEECNRIGRIPLGEAAITGGGELPAQWVIHAAGMDWSGGVTDEACAEATRNSLLRATEKKLKSIAFPAIGTGVGGLDMSACARVMLDAVKRHLEGETSLESVVFVLFDANARAVFEKVWDDLNRAA